MKTNGFFRVRSIHKLPSWGTSRHARPFWGGMGNPDGVAESNWETTDFSEYMHKLPFS